jgi:hypothetical protein
MMNEFLVGKWGRGLLPEYVFLEVVSVMLNRRGFALPSRVGQLLLEAKELDSGPCSDYFVESVAEFGAQ